MVTYIQLASEPWWGAEVEAPAHAAMNERLRAFYGLNKAECASKGDNNHVKGRHRSRTWTRNSAYCTDRGYGDTDSRDKTGDGNWLRATDVGITGVTLQDACKRLDAAVRAGHLPAVAEWFGTFDGKTVVGWFQGHPSSSDSSHLYHLHVGLWTSRCDDTTQLALLGNTIMGGTDMTSPQQVWEWDGIPAPPNIEAHPDTNPTWSAASYLRYVVAPLDGQVKALQAAIDAQGVVLDRILLALATGGGGGFTEEEVRALARDEIDNNTKLTGTGP